MDIGKWVQEGQIVNISTSMEGEDWYASKVAEVGSASFFILPPKKDNGAFSFQPDQRIRVSVPSKEGLFQFTCGVLCEEQGSGRRVELDFPKEVVHLERRAFPRLPVRMDAQYAEIRDGGGNIPYSRSTALDISGGGIRLETNRLCPRESLVRVKFQIPLGAMEEELILTGRIVRSTPAEGARKSQAGVEFIDITPQQQESLVQFILDRRKDARPQA
ncbi:MAG: PilZ domain-containing protein [Anaerolineales bacterium]|nr:PilZ domain-containing protein [Anaerolineales bacterium]